MIRNTAPQICLQTVVSWSLYVVKYQINPIIKTIMEKDKEKYLEALKQNKGKLDERALGESIGFSKEHTDKVIEALLGDEKIEYRMEGACTYKVKE